MSALVILEAALPAHVLTSFEHDCEHVFSVSRRVHFAMLAGSDAPFHQQVKADIVLAAFLVEGPASGLSDLSDAMNYFKILDREHHARILWLAAVWTRLLCLEKSVDLLSECIKAALFLYAKFGAFQFSVPECAHWPLQERADVILATMFALGAQQDKLMDLLLIDDPDRRKRILTLASNFSSASSKQDGLACDKAQARAHEAHGARAL